MIIRSDNFIIRLLLPGCLLFCLMLAGLSCDFGDGSTTRQQPDKIVAPDGYVLLFTGNWQSHIEPCGCTEKQLGGIDRRTETIRKIAPLPEARLMLDAGPLIDDDNRQSQLKFETFLYSMRRLNYDAVSLTGREMVILRDNIAMNPADRPPLICSNMPAEVREDFGAVEFLKKTLRLGSHKLECLIMALTDPSLVSEEFIKDQLKLLDPVETVQKILKDESIASDKAGNGRLVVVMLAQHSDTLLAELRKIAAVDLLVIKDYAERPELNEKKPDGKGPISLTTGCMGKYIAVFEVPVTRLPDSSHYTFSTVEIDAAFKRDPAIAEFVDNYQKSMEIEGIVADEFAILREPLDDNNRFVGSKSCAKCHEHKGQYKSWKTGKHAHALETLVRVNRQFDPECVACHTVGMKYETGYRSIDTTPDLANIGCEMCHGPGGKHVDDDENKLTSLKTCQDCHNHETSPSFEKKQDEYIKKIKHWD